MSEFLFISFQKVFESTAAIAVLLALASSLAGTLASLISNRNPSDKVQLEELSPVEARTSGQTPAKQASPFETTALSSYYNQALSRAQISFWFSLVFASIGFGVIIFAFITHSSTDLVGTIVKVASGAIIDAVSALFFVQSSNAQKAMGEFFEKLRLDRLNAEAREMIREIENGQMRDELRGQLILKYSGIERLLAGGPT